MLLILCFLTGFAMVTVETYWQPAISAFTAETWVLGVVSFIGFAGAIGGSKLAEFLLTRYSRGGIAVFLISKALMSLCLALFMAAKYQVPFVLVYLLWYVFLGGNGVAEQTLINREAPAAQRASVLSLFSLDLQLGGLLAAGACYLIIALSDYRYTWLSAAVLLAAATLVFSVLSLRRRAAERHTVAQVREEEQNA
jgi:predicted MFS family arabinose efflux permease